MTSLAPTPSAPTSGNINLRVAPLSPTGNIGTKSLTLCFLISAFLMEIVIACSLSIDSWVALISVDNSPSWKLPFTTVLAIPCKLSRKVQMLTLWNIDLDAKRFIVTDMPGLLFTIINADKLFSL